MVASGAAIDDSFSRAPEVFHQDDSKGDCYGPELADRERLHTLVGLHKLREHQRVEPAVGMRDKSPSDTEDTRVALERPVGEFRQLTVIAARKIVANFANLFLDDMKVIHQPLCRGRDCAFLADCGCDAPVGGQQDPAVVAQARRQAPSGFRIHRDRLRGGQTFGVLFQALDSEQFREDRRVGVGGEYSGRGS